MNIIEAARAMREGKSVKRETMLYGWTLPQRFAAGWKYYELTIEDLLADDWEIVEGEG